jgi:cation diffusion facilitator family transporter
MAKVKSRMNMSSYQHPAHHGIRAVKKGILLNLFLVVLKGLAGVVGNSYALVADAMESATDVLSSLLVWIGLHTASKPPDHDHPYGHGKAEPMAAGVVSLMLFVVAGLIFAESLHNIQTPHKSPEWWTLLVLAAIVSGKEFAYRMVQRTGAHIESQAVKAEAQHHRADAFSSLAAFIGIVVALLGGEGYESADDWAAMVAAFFIAWNGGKIMTASLSELMDTALPQNEVNEVIQIALQVKGVKKVESCVVRKTGFEWFVDITIQVDGDLSVSEGHAISHEVNDAIQSTKNQVYAVHTHVEPFQI